MSKRKNRNPVAKNMERFNRPTTHEDRRKSLKKGYEKHKKKDFLDGLFGIFFLPEFQNH